MSNITATSSASPPPIKAQSWPTAGPLEDAARQARNTSDPTMPSDLAPATSEASSTKATAPTARVQDAKTQDAKAQDAKAQDAKALAEAVGELNERFKSLSRTNLQFNINDEADRIVVKVMDAEKDEMIRQIPPEEILELAAFLKSRAEEDAQQMERAAGLAPETSALEGLLLHTKA